jgi:hypothetical protein
MRLAHGGSAVRSNCARESKARVQGNGISVPFYRQVTWLGTMQDLAASLVIQES